MGEHIDDARTLERIASLIAQNVDISCERFGIAGDIYDTLWQEFSVITLLLMNARQCLDRKSVV